MDDEKYIDESWKDAVENEKTKEPDPKLDLNLDGQTQDPAAQEEGDFPGLDFFSYISSLAFQAMIFLGDIPSPITDQLEKNLAQAKLIIDTLAMLKEKTAGNLSPEEDDTLSTCVYELQMKYVQAAQKGETA